MGSRVLSRKYSDLQPRSGRKLRAYAHCAAPSNGSASGDVATVLINLENVTSQFNVSFSKTAATDADTVGAVSAITKYVLTSATGRDYTGREVLLNGRKLAPRPDGSPPDMIGVQMRPAVLASKDGHVRTAISVPPFAVAFVILHGVNASTCG